MFVTLLSSNVILISWGYLIIRVGLGLIMMLHGLQKLFGGPSAWQGLGSQMANVGITFLPLFWGLMAVCAELGGGLLLVLGLGTRLGALLISCVMIVALSMHRKNGDPFTTYSHPLTILIVMLGLIIGGSGHYSVDKKLEKVVVRR